jgi:hypothetical protein
LEDNGPTDWSKSYHGLSNEPFSGQISDILQARIDPLDIEIKPGVFVFLVSALLGLTFAQTVSFIFPR